MSFDYFFHLSSPSFISEVISLSFLSFYFYCFLHHFFLFVQALSFFHFPLFSLAVFRFLPLYAFFHLLVVVAQTIHTGIMTGRTLVHQQTRVPVVLQTWSTLQARLSLDLTTAYLAGTSLITHEDNTSSSSTLLLF